MSEIAQSANDDSKAYDYHMSQSRARFVLARRSESMFCRIYYSRVFHPRRAMMNYRWASLHIKLRDICLEEPEPSEESMRLYDYVMKYLPIAGALTSDEYRRLQDESTPKTSAFEVVADERLCRACRNLNLRKESFELLSWRHVTSITGDIRPDEDYSDQDLDQRICQEPGHGAMTPQRLGDLFEIAKHLDCPFCRLVTNCFLRFSVDEFSVHNCSTEAFHFDGAIWLTLLLDRSGDNFVSFANKRWTPSNKRLISAGKEMSLGRIRVILSLLDQDSTPKRDPLHELHSEVLPVIDNKEATRFETRIVDLSYIDPLRPREWLHTCEQEHGERCSAPAIYQQMEAYEDMFLIDVINGCLVPGYKSRRYFALSYVWGKGQSTTFQTTTATIAGLQIPGALFAQREAKTIANTITDAIVFTQEMGEQYLWVDALCIVQDDPSSKFLQINHMDAIYRQAILTIIAADNKDVKDGLCGGVSRPRESLQRLYSYRHGISFTASDAVFGDVEVAAMSSPWASRAWTYQERLFSRRLLIFMDSTIHWTCNCLRWSETEANPSEEGPPPWEYYNNPIFLDTLALYLGEDAQSGIGSLTFVWQNIVKTFSGLALSFEQDVFMAIAGLENYIARYFDTCFAFGMPEADFVGFLLWHPDIGVLARRRGVADIPSWSWAGWVGKVTFHGIHRYENEGLDERFVIEIPRREQGDRSLSSMIHTCDGIISIHTMWNIFRIGGSRELSNPPPWPQVMPWQVFDTAGNIVGAASLSLDEALKEQEDGKVIDNQYEVIVIANEILDELSLRESNGIEKYYWVLIIQWHVDLAERIGIATIEHEAWHAASPIWRDLKLR